jgi:hypothetical protein
MKGEEVLAVPASCWITIDNVVQDSPLCKKLNENAEMPKILSQPWIN